MRENRFDRNLIEQTEVKAVRLLVRELGTAEACRNPALQDARSESGNCLASPPAEARTEN
jgi:hypothetical protein